MASTRVDAIPPLISGASTMKSTVSLNTGRISSKVRRLFSPEKFTEVENIGPDIGNSERR